MNKFYDREEELTALTRQWEAHGAQFMLLYGRRRVGKTYLLQHFFREGRPNCYFLASQTSLAENMHQLAEELTISLPDSGFRPADLPTFNSILKLAGSQARDHRFALILDEFQYLVEQDPSIPSQIQAWWDGDAINSSIFLVLCGSHLSMMEGLGGPQAPLFGRFTLRHKLLPMTYQAVADFYADSAYSKRDKLLAYGILGGTPKYQALFDPEVSIRDNTCSHILADTGLLRTEPQFLLSSGQIRDPSPYNATLRAIAEGCTRPTEIGQHLDSTPSQLSFYLRSLMELEWVKRERSFGEKTDSRTIYKIADNFLLFWYRFVAGLQSELEFQPIDRVYRDRIEPYLNDYMGWHVFEDVCHQYLREHGSQLLGKAIRDAGKYWSRDGQLELDIIAELEDGHYLLGECKWSSSPVGISVYHDLIGKAARLPEAKYKDQPTYIIFSMAGFDDHLRETAQRDGVLLVSGDELLDD